MLRRKFISFTLCLLICLTFFAAPLQAKAPTPTEVVPTYGCIGGFPCASRAPENEKDAFRTFPTTPPSFTKQQTANPNQTAADPCITESQTSIQTHDGKKHRKHKGNDSRGAIEKFIQFLLLFILELLRQLGLQIPPPTPTPTPTPTIPNQPTPSVPVPTQPDSTTPTPTVNPSPTANVTPCPSVTANPTVTNVPQVTPTPTIFVIPTVTTVPTPTIPTTCSGTPIIQVEEGPYYKVGSPERQTIREATTPTTPLTLEGYVFDANCTPIANAWLDFWQANGNGEYDNVGFILRGHQFTDASGRYKLVTVIPGIYPGRTEHIHVKLMKTSTSPVVTSQLFIPGGTSNSTDPLYNPSLLINMTDNPAGGKTATYNFVIN